jgi:DNA-binding SARP family transcriptional activator
VAVESLISAAWEDEPPAEGRTNIHVYVSNLRRVLGTGDADGRLMLEKRSPGYQLNVTEENVDAGRFIKAASAGVAARAAIASTAKHIRILRKVVPSPSVDGPARNDSGE